jgi:hypothetical protein
MTRWLISGLGVLATALVVTFLIVPAVATGKSSAVCKMPTLSSVSPQHGSPGTEVTLKGSNLKNVDDDGGVAFDDYDADNIRIKNATIKITVPSIPPGRYTLSLDGCGDDMVAVWPRGFLVTG